jgi:hypothetical protein
VAARQVLLASLSLLVALVLLPGSGSAADEHISEIKATFVPAEFATHYTVGVTGFPENSRATWTLELKCVDTGCPDTTGTVGAPKPNVDTLCNNNGSGVIEPERDGTGPDPPEFIWHHPSASQDTTGTYHCDHAREGLRGHQGLITIVVTDPSNGYSCSATYKGTNTSTSTSVQDGTASAPECQAGVAAPECLQGVTITKKVINGLHWDKFKSVFGASSNDAVTHLGPNEVVIGRREVFRVLITITNNGSCTLHDVDVRDVMPAGWGPVKNDKPGSSNPINNTEVSILPRAGPFPKDPVLPKIEGLSSGHDQVSYVFPTLEPHYEARIIVGGYLTEGGDYTNQARLYAPAELASNKVVIHATPNPYISKILPKDDDDEVYGDADEGKAKGFSLGGVAKTPALWRLKRVEVAIRSLSGAGKKACLWRRANGSWSKAKKKFKACEQPVWLRARGTTHWVLKLGRALPPGTYLVRARAINAGGVKGKYRQVRFSVR